MATPVDACLHFSLLRSRRFRGSKMNLPTFEQKMKTKEIIKRSWKFVAPYGVAHGKKFGLNVVDPNDTGESISDAKPRAKEILQRGIKALTELQDLLHRQDQSSMLPILQTMDAAGIWNVKPVHEELR